MWHFKERCLISYWNRVQASWDDLKYGIALFVYFSGCFSFYFDCQGWPREVVQDILVCSIWIYVRDTRIHIPTQELCSNELVFMPPPLGAGGIMFSGCPSFRPSVRPKPEIPSFDLYVGPLVHPTNRNRFTACPSVRPSGEVSGHLPENAWRDWPEILLADVSWPTSKLISLWPWSVDFSNFGTILT